MTTHRYNALIQVPERTKWTKEGGQVVIEHAATIRVFVEIDETLLAAHLGRKAWANKSKKSHEVGGIVRVIECRKEARS